jgi:serine protease inhibitor
VSLIGVRRSIVPVALATLACSDPSAPAPEPITALPRQLTTAEQKLISGSNTFAFDLLREINTSQRDSNVFVSPLSASMALGMTANGAEGTTYDAMHTALRLGDASREDVNEGYKSLIALLRGLDKSTDFRIANSIWYEKTFPFNASFLTESKTFFDAEVAGLDFTNPSAVSTINSWVDRSTNSKIPSIIDRISDEEVMFLINAIYFKGSWQKQFEKSQTSNAPFTAYDGTSASVPLMHQSVPLRVAGTSSYVAADLLYGNTAFAMTVVLPNVGVDVNTVAQSLTHESWKSLEQSFHEQKAELYLPRFKLTWQRLLNDDLTGLGMGIAFQDSRANFTRMSPLGDRLFITKVIQKTFVDVNEEGTEAAAVTSVGIGITSAPQTVIIRVDRPFIFVIRERLSGTILFMGKIVKLPVT